MWDNRIFFFFCLRTILRADRADEGSEGTRLRGSHTVSWWQAGLGHLDQEAVWCGGLKSSAAPRLLQTFRGVTFQPAGSPVCPYFSLPDLISSGPQHLCGKNLRDTRSSGARTLALAVLTGGPTQSDSSSPPLMGSSLLPGQCLCGGPLCPEGPYRHWSKPLPPCAAFLFVLTLPKGTLLTHSLVHLFSKYL